MSSGESGEKTFLDLNDGSGSQLAASRHHGTWRQEAKTQCNYYFCHQEKLWQRRLMNLVQPRGEVVTEKRNTTGLVLINILVI